MTFEWLAHNIFTCFYTLTSPQLHMQISFLHMVVEDIFSCLTMTNNIVFFCSHVNSNQWPETNSTRGTRWWTSIYKNEKVALLYTFLLQENHCEILSLFLLTLVLLFPQPVSFPMDNTSLPPQKHPYSKLFHGPQECFKTWLGSEGLILEKTFLCHLHSQKRLTQVSLRL